MDKDIFYISLHVVTIIFDRSIIIFESEESRYQVITIMKVQLNAEQL